MARGQLRGAAERGQATLLLLAVIAALLAGTLILFGFGQALGARSKHQRAADLAAVSATQVMRCHYTRLFEAAVFENGLPNPRHLSNDEYLALARRAAPRGARRNGVAPRHVSVSFPAAGFAPTRVKVTTRGATRLRLGQRRPRERIPVEASATAEITPDLGVAFGRPTHGSGGGYDSPLAYRMGNPDPRWVAPPGTSLHRYATELDLGPPAAWPWLKANAGRFGFIHRYAWEAWHYG